LWASRPYRLLFLAGFLSELGTFISETAILMRIYELVGHQKQYLGITQGIFLLMMILGTLLGGVFGERQAKRQILLGCEIARIPILLTMVAFTNSPWVLIICNGWVAFYSGAFNPTRQALMNALLPKTLLPKANSVFSMSFAFLHAVGPVLGGLLYGYAQSLSPVLFLDLATYCVGIALLLKLSNPTPPPASQPLQASESSFFNDLKAGFQLVCERPEFFWIISRCILASVALGIVIPLLLPMTTEVLLLPESSYGYLLGTFGLGGAVGSLFLPRVLNKFTVENVLRGVVLCEGLTLWLWATTALPALSFPFAFGYGALLFARITTQLNFVSIRLPDAFNARANALFDLAMVVPNVAGAGIVGFAGATLKTEQFLKGTAIIVCISVAVSYALEWRLRRGGVVS
ncbi:MAG: MFS transporter, partial [Verrucomicrobiota bacterium]